MISILFEHHFAKDNGTATEIAPFQYFRHYYQIQNETVVVQFLQLKSVLL